MPYSTLCHSPYCGVHGTLQCWQFQQQQQCSSEWETMTIPCNMHPALDRVSWCNTPWWRDSCLILLLRVRRLGFFFLSRPVNGAIADYSCVFCNAYNRLLMRYLKRLLVFHLLNPSLATGFANKHSKPHTQTTVCALFQDNILISLIPKICFNYQLGG